MPEISSTNNQVTVGNSFGAAKDLYLKNIVLLLTVQVIMAIPQLATSFIENKYLGALASIMLQSPLWGGYWTILVALVDGGTPQISDLFSKASMFWRFLVVTLITHVVIFVGCLLFIVPGIIAGIHLNFCNACVANEGLGPIGAIKRSSELTKGYRWQLFGIFMAMMGIALVFGIAGGIVFGIPGAIIGSMMHADQKQIIQFVVPVVVFPFIIFVALITAHLYRQLQAIHSQAPQA